MISVRLSAIVAHDLNYGIGLAGEGLPWRLKDDLRHFAALTADHVCIVGRATFEAMPPLKNRVLVVVSSSLKELPPSTEEVYLVSSIQEAIDLASDLTVAKQLNEVYVIGGGDIYAAAFPYLDRIYATCVKTTISAESESLKSFPRPSPELWHEVSYGSRFYIYKNADNQFDAVITTHDRVR